MKTNELHPKNRRAAVLTCSAWLLSMFAPQAANSAEWSDTEVNYQYGTQFEEPFNPDDVTKNIITLQHASGYKYGSNFFFVDFLRSDSTDDNAGEVYGEWYTHLSLSKTTGANLSYGIIKDVSLTAGINYGAKNTGANPRVFLPGFTVDLNLPGFTYFGVDVLAYIDRGKFKPNFGTTLDNCGENETSYQINPFWQLPFRLGPTKWSFEGHVDFIGSRADCENEILAQPQLRLDVGNFVGKPDTAYVGIEYQYWRNKFGFKDVDESVPQFFAAWKF